MRSPPAVAPFVFPLVGAVLIYRSGLIRWPMAALFSPFPGSIPGWHVPGAVGACVLTSCVLSCTGTGCLVIHDSSASCAVPRIYHIIDSLYMLSASCVLGVSQLVNPYWRGSVVAPNVAALAPRLRASGVL